MAGLISTTDTGEIRIDLCKGILSDFLQFVKFCFKLSNCRIQIVSYPSLSASSSRCPVRSAAPTVRQLQLRGRRALAKTRARPKRTFRPDVPRRPQLRRAGPVARREASRKYGPPPVAADANSGRAGQNPRESHPSPRAVVMAPVRRAAGSRTRAIPPSRAPSDPASLIVSPCCRPMPEAHTSDGAFRCTHLCVSKMQSAVA